MGSSIEDINEALGHYCLSVNINKQYDRGEVVYGLGSYNYRVPTNHIITVELRFDSNDQLSEFLNDITKHRQEAQLRETSPTLQKAWEEYQILLKLSK